MLFTWKNEGHIITYKHIRESSFNVLINFQKTISPQFFFNFINLHASPTHIKLHTHVQQL